MLTVKDITLIFVLVLCFYAPIQGQNSYQLLFKNSLNDYPEDVIEKEPGVFLAVGRENIGDFYRYSYKSKIWQFSSATDTLSTTILFHDTASELIHIEKTNNDFHVFGHMFIPPDYNKISFFALEIDTSYNKIRQRVISIAGWDKLEIWLIKKLLNHYYCFGKVSNGEYYEECIIVLNNNFEVINQHLYQNVHSASSTFHDCMLSRDSTQLLAIEYYDDLTVFDTSLNFIRKKAFPFVFNPNTLDVEVDYEGSKTVRWLTDSTFLIGFINTRLLEHQTKFDDAVSFAEMDTTLTLVPITSFGSIDTSDYTAWRTTFDFVDDNRIFFTGTSNMGFGPFPTQPSWIMAGMINRQLEPQFIHYYGGDAYYTAHSMHCTSDGGMIVVCNRYDYHSGIPENEAFFLKLNAQGLITDNQNIEVCPQSVFYVNPNPAEDYISLYLVLNEADLKIIDQNGQIAGAIKLEQGANQYKCANLKPGIYICQVTTNEKETYTKKIIIK